MFGANPSIDIGYLGNIQSWMHGRSHGQRRAKHIATGAYFVDGRGLTNTVTGGQTSMTHTLSLCQLYYEHHSPPKYRDDYDQLNVNRPA